MSQMVSPEANRVYGIQRVCRIWGQARSTFYHKTRQSALRPALRRGPRPSVDDDTLLAMIQKDIETSPFTGEGHRKVWARLRYRDGVKVARKRVLRIMRENHLLSPYRTNPRKERKHDGKIITMAPNVMWGTDGARVFTLEDGWVWIFTAIEHWNAECLGWHVCKIGDRYAALQPISMALNKHYGSIDRGAARGLTLRMDHGTQYLSDHFLNQLKYWGIKPSFAFVAQPQTNGVAERFNRTMKEQAIYGRNFVTIEDVREAVRDFVALYNKQWQIEKIDFKSPEDARDSWNKGLMAA